MLRNFLGFFVVWLLVFGVYCVWSNTTGEKLKIGKGVWIATLTSIFAALLTAFIVITF